MARIILGLVALLGLAAMVIVAVLVLRPATSADSTVDADVTIECTAATGLDRAACRDRGDAILADGAPTTTFEAEDVVRLRIDRELLGFGDSCHAEWFLGRYPDDVAWSDDLDCASD